MTPDAEARDGLEGHGWPGGSGGPGERRPGVPWRMTGLTALVVGVVGIALGPRPDFDDRWVEPPLPVGDAAAQDVAAQDVAAQDAAAQDVAALDAAALDAAALDAYLDAEEAAVPDLRAGDAKGVAWADPGAPMRTSISLVYLHGFSADRHELEPVVSEVGRALGANVYFARLTGHGRDGAAMADASAGDWLDDTAEAVAVGEAIGERVVLIGTSTGGTLASWAATRPESAGRIAAVVLVSPNVQPKDRSSRILLYPWGGLLARLVVGQERCFEAENAAQERHWTTCYPTSALLPMMALVEHVRTMSFTTWDVPALLVYSRRDEVVDAAETERVFDSVPDGLLRVHVVEETGDPAHHVLAGDVLSPGTNQELQDVIEGFVRDVSEPTGTG